MRSVSSSVSEFCWQRDDLPKRKIFLSPEFGTNYKVSKEMPLFRRCLNSQCMMTVKEASMPKPSSIRPVVSTQCHNGNVTSAGWQVTLCDPMWHASSCSGVATMRTAIHFCYLLTYLLTYNIGLWWTWQTHDDSIYRASMASRDKNRHSC